MLKQDAARLLIAVAVCMLRRGQAASTGGELWNEINVSAPLSGRATLTVAFVLRDSLQLPDPQLAGLGAIVGVAVAQRCTITAGYLFVPLPHTGPGYFVHVPLAALTIRGEVGQFHLQDRNRSEGLIGLPNSPIRYRNKLMVELPSPWPRWLRFMSDETFYDFSRSLWSQNRYQAGLGRQMNEQLRLDVFYLEREAHQRYRSATLALGLTLEVRLTAKTRRKGVSHEEN